MQRATSKSNTLEITSKIPSTTAISVLALGSALPVIARGNATVLDIVSILMAPITLPIAFKNTFLKRVIISALLMNLVQSISDLAHRTQLISMPGLLGLQISLLVSIMYWFYDSKKIPWRIIVVSVSIGMIALQFLGHWVNSSNIWKYNLNFAICTAAFSLALSKNSLSGIQLCFGFLAIVLSLIFDFRAALFASALYLITSLYLILTQKKGAIPRKSINNQKPLVLVILAIGILVIIFSYPKLAADGVLGTRASEQQIALNSEGLGSYYLLNARPELPYILILSSRSPWLGYGSYGTPTGTDVYSSLEKLNRVLPLSDVNLRNWLLASNPKTSGYNVHTRLGATAFSGGLFTLIFWLYYLGTTFRIALQSLILKRKETALLTFLLFWAFWDTLFSPLTVTARFEIAISLFVNAVVQKKITQSCDD